MPVTLGSERLLESGRLRGRRVGLVANPASVDRELRHVVDRVASDPDITLAALFGPQHGFNADAQENMIETEHARHPRLGVPVHSLYSDTREPTDAMLDGLDLLVVDLQDVGTRVYTYVYTMANCLRTAARRRLPVIVCDRPNPIGDTVEGPMLHAGYESFVGQFSIPMRHGMTIGELARLFNDHFRIGVDLDVVTLDGWTRDAYQDATDAPWVIPSPNLPTLDSAIVYPGCVLFEGTNLSEGRGTTRPFELVGAPWIDAATLAAALNGRALPGVCFRPVVFEPTFHKHAGQTCGGCQLHVTNRAAFRPVLAAVTLLQTARAAGPERFAWRQPPYEYEHEKMPIDILAGSDQLRTEIERDTDAVDIAAGWTAEVEAFEDIRRRYLLY